MISPLTPSRRRYYPWRAVISIAVTLGFMPLAHIVARILKDSTSGIMEFYAAMGMGFVGLCMVVHGVFTSGQVKQTLLGLLGGMFYWMGAVDFLFMYYAQRYGTQAQIDPVTGEVVSRPEYLLLQSTFGLWAMVMTLYLFCTTNGCNFISWWQKRFFGSHKRLIASLPMTRHVSIVSFMEVMTMLWTCYLLLMFCYDPRFIGDHHPITFMIGLGGLAGSIMMFERLLTYHSWGLSLRYGFATVIIFWIAVEVCDRIHLLQNISNHPSDHLLEMISVFTTIIATLTYLYIKRTASKS